MTKWMKHVLAAIVILGLLATSLAFSVSDTRGASLKETNTKLRKQLAKEREELKVLRKLAAPILRPTPEGNRALARAYFGYEYPAAAKIIEGETAGTWRHDIWNGFAYGAWPERTDFDGSCDAGEAYGLGQACERDKMLAHGDDAYENPLTQYVWFRAYAEDRYDSVQGAAAHWTPSGSW